MVQVKAPSLAGEQAPDLDLVAVVDVSGSMAGPKLEEAKRAVGLVVDSLGARDRLSVVAFSGDARRVVPPTRMSGDGKAAARLAVESLAAGSTTNIRAGLDEAAKVVEECRRDNDAAGVILLSDGIAAIKSGRYKNIITTTDGEPAWVGVGDLYADEERRFLFLFDVRRIGDANRNRTLLCKVRCEYMDAATGQDVSVEPAYNGFDVDAEVLRPLDVAPAMEVERERLRVEAAEDVALAHAAAERGAYAEAARILGARRESAVSRAAAAALSGDAACEALAAELDELRRASGSTG
ncbi:uncharacterized protein LOC120639295 [Panicum virgatum]|uniref:uncharacterized protein LOC120639295 n=1 Tax=Panicum virgatum TaxID=38727 RepID=UPI0019D63308|nr:uncharacterized protein LOC120639295 [Panicum virgatum]